MTWTRQNTLGYGHGELMSNGYAAGMGPGAMYRGELGSNSDNNYPSLPALDQPFKFDQTPRHEFSTANSNTFSASREVIDKSIGGRITESSSRVIDPGVSDLVRILEQHRPGITKEIMVKIREGAGNDKTDLDIVTKHAIIQLTQSKKGLGEAITKAQEAIIGTEMQGKQVIGFVAKGVDSRLLYNNPKRHQSETRVAFNTIQDLVKHLDSLSE
jgi:hypothetical protein